MSYQTPRQHRSLLIGFFGVSFATIFVISQVVVPRLDHRFNPVDQPGPYVSSRQAALVHSGLFVADLHSDMLLWARKPDKRHQRGHTDIPRLIEGNVALQVFSAVTKSPRGQNYSGNSDDTDRITLLAIAQGWPVRTWSSLLERALFQADRLNSVAQTSGDALRVIRSREDLLDAASRDRGVGPVSGLLAVEGLHALEGDITNVDRLFDAGYRMMAPVHMFDNKLGGSAHGIEKGAITPFGVAVLKRMEELGVAVDLAHASAALFDDVVRLAANPIIVSHTGVDGTCPGPRNLSDEQIRQVAASGGVIGVGFWPGAVCGSRPDAIAKSIRYVANLVGVQYVGYGSDFDGTVQTPFDATGLAQLTEALLDEGFTLDEIALISGGNIVRVLSETLPTSPPTSRS